MRVSKRQLRRIIREELLREQPAMSNSDLSSMLKGNAAEMASAIPTKLNDDFSRALEMLAAMSKYDVAAFNKIMGYLDNLGAKALEKAKKGEEPEATEGEGAEGKKPSV